MIRIRSLFRSGAGIGALVIVSQTMLLLIPMAICSTLAMGRWRRNVLSQWPVVLLLLVLALINSQKWPDSDLGEYYRYIDYVAQTPLPEVLSTDVAFVSIDPMEVLFKLYVWVLAIVGGGTKIFFTFVSSMLTYAAFAFTCAILLRDYAGAVQTRHTQASHAATDVTPAALLICAALLLGVTFSVTAHLTRQYLAGAAFFVGMFAFASGRDRRWLLLSFASMLVHRSTIVLMLPLAIALLHRRFPRSSWLAVLLIIVAGVLNPLEIHIDVSSFATLFMEDGAQGSALMALDGLVCVAAWRAVRHVPPRAQFQQSISTILVFMVAFGSILYVFRDVPLLFFRSYFYVEFLRTPLLALTMFVMLQRVRRMQVPLALALSILAAVACWARTSNSEWAYGGAAGVVPFSFFDIVERWDRIESIPW